MPLLIFIYSMMGQLISKYEPFWQEVSIESLILRWPLRPLGLLFKRKMLYSIDLMCKCLSICKGIFRIVSNWKFCCLILKCYTCNRGRLMWNSNTSHKKWYLTCKYEIYKVNSKNMKSSCNWHDFEFQTHRVFHIVPKGEVCITLWRTMVYRRIMTKASLWSLQ